MKTNQRGSREARPERIEFRATSEELEALRRMARALGLELASATRLACVEKCRALGIEVQP